MDIKCFGSGSSGNSYLVSDKGTCILIDAGVNPKKIARKLGWINLIKVDACLVTHEHQDHAKYVKELLDMGIECFMTQGTQKALDITDRKINIIPQSSISFKVHDWSVMAIINNNHDAAEPVNFKIYSKDFVLLYITDTSDISCWLGCELVTHLMVEANYSESLIAEAYKKGILGGELYKRIINNHLSFEKLLKWLDGNDLSTVKQIYVMHLSDKDSDEAYFKEKVQELTGIETYITKAED